MSDDDVAVATVQGLLEAENLRAFLGAHGIPTRTRTQIVQQQHALTVDGLGAVVILVPAHLAEDARELIAQAESGELDLPTDEDPV